MSDKISYQATDQGRRAAERDIRSADAGRRVGVDRGAQGIQLTVAILVLVLLGHDVSPLSSGLWLVLVGLVVIAGQWLHWPVAAGSAGGAGSRWLRRLQAGAAWAAALPWVVAAWWLVPESSLQAPLVLLTLALAGFAAPAPIDDVPAARTASLAFTVTVVMAVGLRLLTFAQPTMQAAGVGLILLAVLRCRAQCAAVRRTATALRTARAALRLARRHALRAGVAQRERVRVEAALAAAEHADHDKTRFLAAASHDLRQPVHAVGLFVAALRAEPLEERARYLVDRLARSLDGLDELFNRLLDISRLDAGGIQPDIRLTSAQHIAQTLEARFAAMAAQRRLKLRVRVTPGLQLRTDDQLLSEILTNLLSNALHATARGGVLLAIRGHGATARVQVWDTGAGIAAGDHERIFDEFVRLGGEGIQRRSRGHGLGLAIVRRLAAMLGYPVTVRSVPSRGSLFELRVPCSLCTEQLGSDPVDATDDDPELAGTMVLVVDDDSDVLAAMSSLLSAWNCYVLVARSAAEAVERVSEAARFPDLLIADQRLEDGKAGDDVVRALAAVLPEPLPVVIVSAGQCPAASGDPAAPLYLSKPVNARALRAAMAAALKRAQPASLPVPIPRAPAVVG